jgi:hypothetical protein
VIQPAVSEIKDMANKKEKEKARRNMHVMSSALRFESVPV